MVDKNLLVLSGPSGVGKTYLVSILCSHGFMPVVMTTTRKPRIGETNGVDYEFLAPEDYTREIFETDDFFMNNNFLGNYYGIRRSAGQSVWDRHLIPILVIFTAVIEQVVNEFPFAKKVFLYPLSLDIVRERLLQRDGNLSRLPDVHKELSLIVEYRCYYDAVIGVKDDSTVFIVSEVINLFNPSRR